MLCDKIPVLLLTGYLGSGKTTLAGKLANYFKKKGKTVTLVAGDTFRAAAEEQLNIWSERAGADIVRRDKADPASVFCARWLNDLLYCIFIS